MKFSKETLLDLMYECEPGYDTDGCELIDSGKWISEGKRDYREWIFKFDTHYYKVCDSREGSYHTDYYHDSDDFPNEVECKEVFPKKVIQIIWVDTPQKENEKHEEEIR